MSCNESFRRMSQNGYTWRDRPQSSTQNNYAKEKGEQHFTLTGQAIMGADILRLTLN